MTQPVIWNPFTNNFDFQGTSGGGGGSPIAFDISLSGNISNITGDGSVYQIPLNTVNLDTNSAFDMSTNNYVFPVTGIYQINMLFYIFSSSSDVSSTVFTGYAFINGATNFRLIDADPQSLGLSTAQEFIATASFLYNATLGDTMGMFVNSANGTKNIGVAGGVESCRFSGFKIG